MPPSLAPLYWVHGLRNFGDRLSPLIFRHITGRLPEYATPGSTIPHYLCVGSMLADANEHSMVWGTGILKWTDQINTRCRIAMVRGPLSYAAVCSQGGTCPPIWGDPVGFVREMFPPSPNLLGDWCVVPHRRERRYSPIDGVGTINVRLPPGEFCAQLTSYRYVLSSSLHGLVAAHAFGLKAAWIKMSDRPLGDDTKFRDYLLSIGLSPEPLIVDELSLYSFQRLASKLATAEIDLDRMRAACPFV